MDSVILNAVKNLAMLLAKSLREILRDAQDDIDDRMLLAKLKQMFTPPRWREYVTAMTAISHRGGAIHSPR